MEDLRIQNTLALPNHHTLPINRPGGVTGAIWEVDAAYPRPASVDTKRAAARGEPRQYPQKKLQSSKRAWPPLTPQTAP